MSDSNPEPTSNVDFASLKLRPGAWLQMQNIEGAAHKSEVEFVSAMHGKSLFVAIPDVTEDSRIQAGERFRVRGFNGVSDFAFTTQVLEVQTKPFWNAHLTYPDSVEARVVRESLRLSASRPATVMFDGGSKQTPATVNDLSVAGALIESATALGAIDDRIEIRITTQFEARETELKIPAVIRHSGKWDPKHFFRSGVEFADIAREDKLVLYYLLFTLAQNER